MDKNAEKILVRQHLRSQLAVLDAAYVATAGEKMAQKLLALPEYVAGKTLFCYVSIGNEPDTRAILAAALGAGKRVCVPKCYGGGRMQARQITNMSQLSPTPLGLLEPEESAPFVPPEALDFVVVPALACTAAGVRLGYGGGYYDRYLATLPCPAACLCYGRRLQPALPAEPFDVPINILVTEEEVLRPFDRR